jgi:hypothetical protein
MPAKVSKIMRSQVGRSKAASGVPKGEVRVWQRRLMALRAARASAVLGMDSVVNGVGIGKAVTPSSLTRETRRSSGWGSTAGTRTGGKVRESPIVEGEGGEKGGRVRVVKPANYARVL